MNYRVELTKDAIKTLDRLDRTLEQRVRARLKLLAVNPYDPRLSKQLVNMDGLRSARVGAWRVLYTVSARRVVFVIAIRPRGEAYR